MSGALPASTQPLRRQLRRGTIGRLWWILRSDLEKRLAKNSDLFPYTSTEEIFNEHRETTRGRDLDITGLSFQLLNEKGPQQWPFKQGQEQGTARLYEDGVFQKPDGKAQFLNAIYKGTADKTDARHPLHLLNRPTARPMARYEPHRQRCAAV